MVTNRNLQLSVQTIEQKRTTSDSFLRFLLCPPSFLGSGFARATDFTTAATIAIAAIVASATGSVDRARARVTATATTAAAAATATTAATTSFAAATASAATARAATTARVSIVSFIRGNALLEEVHQCNFSFGHFNHDRFC